MDKKIKLLSEQYGIPQQEFKKIADLIGEVDDIDLFLAVYAIVKDISRETTNRIYFFVKMMFSKNGKQLTVESLKNLFDVTATVSHYKVEKLSTELGRYNLALAMAVANNFTEILSLREHLMSIKEAEEKYICYLKGEVYGMGDMKYMLELFTDYFLTMDMYGRDEAEFKVVRRKQ